MTFDQKEDEQKKPAYEIINRWFHIKLWREPSWKTVAIITGGAVIVLCVLIALK